MEDAIVTLNVGGTIFMASSSVLKRCGMFNAMLEDVPYEGQTIYIDRCGHIFKHVLGYLRDYRYPYPSKYLYELDYYLVDKDNINLHSLEKELHSYFFPKCMREECHNTYPRDEDDYCADHRVECSYVICRNNGITYCNKPAHHGRCIRHRNNK